LRSLNDNQTANAMSCIRNCIDSAIERKSTFATLELTEHVLIAALKEAEVYPWASDSMLALYQQHFLVRHSLFALRAEYQQRSISLVLTATGVSLSMSGAEKKSASQRVSAKPRDSFDELNAYYADLSHFEQATEDTVLELLASFWKRFHAGEQRSEALAALELPSGASWADVQKRYRALAQEHHPDHGGDPERFVAIRSAYQQLKDSMC